MPTLMTKKAPKTASKGRRGDTELVHVTKKEIAVLKAMGGSGTRNPETGLREFFGVDGDPGDATSGDEGSDPSAPDGGGGGPGGDGGGGDPGALGFDGTNDSSGQGAIGLDAGFGGQAAATAAGTPSGQGEPAGATGITSDDSIATVLAQAFFGAIRAGSFLNNVSNNAFAANPATEPQGSSATTASGADDTGGPGDAGGPGQQSLPQKSTPSARAQAQQTTPKQDTVAAPTKQRTSTLLNSTTGLGGKGGAIRQTQGILLTLGLAEKTRKTLLGL